MTACLKTELNLYNELTIYAANGDILYRGKPEGYSVEKANITETGTVVLLKYSEKKYGSFENLLLLTQDGTVLWRAELPTSSSTDAYVDFELRNSRLFANSWSCYRVEIDMRTGRILNREFTK